MYINYSITIPAILGLLVAKSVSQSDYSLFNIDSNQWSTVEERDVCIIGGGSSGVHAAVRLKDMNQTVAIVEQLDYVGGHTYSYVDPTTQRSIDIGVVVFQPFQLVRQYFSRFNVPIVNISSIAGNLPGQPANLSLPGYAYRTINKYIDFRNGAVVPGIPDIDPGLSDAIKGFIAVLSKYKYILDGYDLPKQVPEDLYLPFGEFIAKYNLSSAVRIEYAYSQGQGEFLNVPTLYIVKYFNLQDFLDLAGTASFLSTARGYNSQLYQQASEYIGSSNIFLSSSVLTTTRHSTPNNRTKILISRPLGGPKLLSCSKTLLTIPPTLLNLANWDLSPTEHEAFSQWTTANGYWTGLLTNVGLNESITYYNTAPRPKYNNLPVQPSLYSLAPVGIIPDVWQVKFGAPTPAMTDSQVQAYIEAEIALLQRTNNATVTKPKWLIFQSHTPFQLQVSPEAIKNGFYKTLTGLQGGFGGTMWYTGAAFHMHDSSFLWRFNEDVVLPKMMGAKYVPPFKGYVAGSLG